MNEDGLNKNIVLIGMPGAGKSYIGGKLAKLLAHFNYVDTDEAIEEKVGLSIPEIFSQYSEDYFRTIESEIIKEISKSQNQIISIGGGAFENSENIEALKKTGLIFYLKAPVEELFRRIENEEQRPLLNCENPKGILIDLLKRREKKFIKAHFTIDTNQKQAYTILDDILREYENYVKCANIC